MMAHSLSDMENYFSELEDFITLSDNDKVHLFHSSMLEILILKVIFIIKSHPSSQNLDSQNQAPRSSNTSFGHYL